MSDDKKSYQDDLDAIVRMQKSEGFPHLDHEWLLRSDYGFCTHCDIDIGEVERAARIDGFRVAYEHGLWATNQGVGIRKIATDLKVGVCTVYKVLEAA